MNLLTPTGATWPQERGHHLIVGPPQSGKTTAAAAAFVDHVTRRGPSRAVFLTPTRQRAAELQNRIARAFGGTTGQLLVRTPASLAFGLLRQAAVLRGDPPPTLITGPEQDHILAELIAGHLEDGIGPEWPAEITPEVLSMRAFRDELRDLLMRAAEAGLDGEGLTALGVREDRPEWVAAGQILSEYTAITVLGEVTPDRGARYDAAAIVDRAAREVAANPRVAAFDAIVHDDYQDATLATSRLLGALAMQGANLLLTSNPDTAVQGFRGALPALTRTATLPEGSQDGAFGARVHTLTEVSMRPGLWRSIVHLTDDLPALVASERRLPRMFEGPEPAGEPVEAHVLTSPPAEAAHIARRLRELRIVHGWAWSDMAVIVRGHQQLQRLRRALTTAGVPVRVSGAELPLREEPVVRALLTCLAIVTRAGGPTTAEVTALLMSPFGGIDALALRRLRRTLRQHDPTRSSGDLLVDALAEEPLREAAGNHPGLHRVARMLTAGRAAVEDSASVEEVLWQIWDAAGLATTWQERALTPGPGAARADADLDAAVALFTVAEQFTTRRAGADPRAFIDHLDSQDFPADTLAARADRVDAVAVHTAASAAGEHWPIVIVAGIQEDAWPDLRIRDTLLGANALADLMTSDHRGTSGLQARREILADERRMFFAACSRATHLLIATAVLDTDARPSMFFDALRDGPLQVTHVPPPLDLRGLVGTLRAQVVRSDALAPRAQQLLARLDRSGVAFASEAVWNPSWTGQGGIDEGQKPVLYPSAIEQALTCPLQWFLTNNGGRRAQTRAQNLGNLIHEIARDHPRGTHEDLRAELDARWHTLELPENHLGRAARERAEQMIRALGQYIDSHEAPAQTEVSFDVDVGPVILRGQVDRVEHRHSGPHVVDLKTGATRPQKGEEDHHPQLGAYQLAAAHGAFGGELPEGHSAGASLVFLGINKNVTVREQAPLQEVEPWALAMVEEAAAVVTADEFPARPGRWCEHCPVRSSCPVMAEGTRIGEET